jgi:hypothetical protein
VVAAGAGGEFVTGTFGTAALGAAAGVFAGVDALRARMAKIDTAATRPMPAPMAIG